MYKQTKMLSEEGREIWSPGVGDPTSVHGQVPDNPCAGALTSTYRSLVRNDGLVTKDSLVVTVI